jgi:hypothetical protein
MDEQKKQPELFKANLFSSPGAAATSGGLSFGLAGDSFNSSFSLAPALTPAQSSPSPPRKSDVKTSVPSSGSPASSLTSTPAVKTTPISSLATPTPAVEAELSNVPLDSPPPSSFSSGLVVNSDPVTPHRPLSHIQSPPVGPGWNDPPVPGSSPGTADIFSIQPLAGQPDTPQTTPTATPPVASVAPQQSANPYRLGQQAGGKRVVYGGVATPTSQSAPPTSLPPPPLSTTDYTQGQAQVGVNALPTQHEVGVAQTLRYHWFYLRPNERYWIPFSLVDSAHLEQAWTSAAGNPAIQVSGGCGLV